MVALVVGVAEAVSLLGGVEEEADFGGVEFGWLGLLVDG